jgi:hypothetical protein
MWAVQSGMTQVSQISASDGTYLQSFDSGHGTYAVAFDGANICIQLNSIKLNSNTLAICPH